MMWSRRGRGHHPEGGAAPAPAIYAALTSAYCACMRSLAMTNGRASRPRSGFIGRTTITQKGVRSCLDEEACGRGAAAAIMCAMDKCLAVVVAAWLAAAAAQAALPVQPQRGEHCAALAPKGWSFTGESPAGSSFGADLMRADGRAGASYFLVGVAPGMRSDPNYARWYATPHQAALATLSRLGSVAVQCEPPSVPLPGLQLMQCRTPQFVGVAVYQVFPMADNGYVLAMRSAYTAPGQWARDGEVASAAARSMRCNVPFKPRSFDYTSQPPSAGKSPKGKGNADSQYSRWLGMEHYHDSGTGQNYWVSPSTDWNDNGPRGPGYYYLNVGGEQRKLEPGRSD